MMVDYCEIDFQILLALFYIHLLTFDHPGCFLLNVNYHSGEVEHDQ